MKIYQTVRDFETINIVAEQEKKNLKKAPDLNTPTTLLLDSCSSNLYSPTSKPINHEKKKKLKISISKILVALFF